MTQDVQPLTWQKRTNLEEHQQFFSKINEIIVNLAPTVDEAEAAIAQATQAIADANAAIATANAASAAADAAAQQAQTAANTVAGYNTRLIAVEDEAAGNTVNITDLQDRMGTAEGNIASLGTRMSTAETKNNQQDTAIAALQTADAQNVKINSINDYAVGLTGNQAKSGTMEFYNEVIVDQFIRSIHVQKNGYSVDRTLGSWLPIYYINIGGNTAPQATFFMTFRKGGMALVQYAQWSGTPSLNGILTGNTRTKENLVRASREGSIVTIWVWVSTDEGIRADCIGSYASNVKAYLVTATGSSTAYAISETGYTDENGIEHVFDSYVVFA